METVSVVKNTVVNTLLHLGFQFEALHHRLQRSQHKVVVSLKNHYEVKETPSNTTHNFNEFVYSTNETIHSKDNTSIDNSIKADETASFMLKIVTLWTLILGEGLMLPILAASRGSVRQLSNLSAVITPVKVELFPILEFSLVILTVVLSLWLVLKTGITVFNWVCGRRYEPPIPVQILDVAVFDGFKPEWRVTNSEWFKRADSWFHFHQDELKFMQGITDRSGIGTGTHFAPGVVEFPQDLTMVASKKESEIVMTYCIDKILAQNNLKATDIDIVVTNCSLFNPTPSLASLLVNHYKMRPDIQSFHLGGMGCSASPLACNLASTALRLHPKKHPLALVFSMENITQNIYLGRERGFMLQNALFRIGGAAVLLTRDTKAVLGRPAPKWSIEHSSHIHTAADTDAYTCVFQDIDKEDRKGVRLDKVLMSVAAKTITKNLTVLGPKILSFRAKLEYAAAAVKAYSHKWYHTLVLRQPYHMTPIVPNFKRSIDHFCIHAGGRAVLDAIQKALKLSDADLKPSRDTLYMYGNTSSSSIWYELRQIEKMRKPRKGDCVLQIAVGSGFKANIHVLKALVDSK